MKNKRPEPKFKKGETVLYSSYEKEKVISEDPQWNGVAWMYSFENDTMRCGEEYLKPLSKKTVGVKVVREGICLSFLKDGKRITDADFKHYEKEENIKARNEIMDKIVLSFDIQDKMKKKLAELKSDERLTYPAATVFENSPLALHQCACESQIHLLESILGEPLSSFPLPKQIKK